MVLTIVDQYERGLRFTFGRYTALLNPGICINIPIVHRIIKVDMRTRTMKIPQQEAMTKDNIPLRINAVVYFTVVDPEKAILEIADVDHAVLQYAQTAMRDVIGKNEMDKIISDRERIANQIEDIVDKEVTNWGIDISAIKIQDIEMPEDMKRSMARQAEGERIRRATIILAQGELEAAKNYAKAAKFLAETPGALYLKTLQTLSTSISLEDAPTTIVLVPAQIMRILERIVPKK